jgi:hypothetical protein
MVQTHLTGRANVHGWAQTDRFQTAEDFDGFRVVLMAWRFCRRDFFIAHSFSWREVSRATTLVVCAAAHPRNLAKKSRRPIA